jgi:hypothetical protein
MSRREDGPSTYPAALRQSQNVVNPVAKKQETNPMGEFWDELSILLARVKVKVASPENTVRQAVDSVGECLEDLLLNSNNPTVRKAAAAGLGQLAAAAAEQAHTLKKTAENEAEIVAIRILARDGLSRLAQLEEIRHTLSDEIGQKGSPLSLEEEFAKTLFSGLSGGQEENLVKLSVTLDRYREAIRAKLEAVIHEYMQGWNPTKAPERQRSVDVINSLMKRVGFALEHPDHPGQHCYLTLIVDSGQPQGQIRLLAEGSSSRPLDRSAHLSKFAYLRVIDATVPLEERAAWAPSSPSFKRNDQGKTDQPPSRGR